jgi:AMP nucleosidase
MVNIGVGPANAKTITDHIAVLRPHAWIMLGHRAGLRTTQQLGDYVLAHGYAREDHVLDEDRRCGCRIPPLAEVQVAIESAVADITQLQGYELKRVMRTGTVAKHRQPQLGAAAASHARAPLQPEPRHRADMESATIAANGFRFRVPYGTLLCVSDKPLHGAIKLPGMADHFYRERVDQHLRIGIRAIGSCAGKAWTSCTAASSGALRRWRFNRSYSLTMRVIGKQDRDEIELDPEARTGTRAPARRHVAVRAAAIKRGVLRATHARIQSTR